MSPEFYAAFADFDYILIYQLDAFVFYGYDFIGAPSPRMYRHDWTRIISCVGNGGFSLRKVQACREVSTIAATLPNWSEQMKRFEEDSFFALCGTFDDMNFNVAPVEVAEKFSMEWHPARAVKKLGNRLPFGCHNWHRFGADFYVEIFAQLGYDLRPFREQMLNNDRDVQMRLGLEILATRRLIRRTERGQSISHYLPTKNFASVRVLRSPDTLKILSRLLWEGVFAEKIFIRDTAEVAALLDDIHRENLPHLLIATEHDDLLLAELKRRAFVYGEQVIWFQLEYFRRCEEIFHSLGR